MNCDGRRSCGECLRPNFTTEVMLLTGKAKMYYTGQCRTVCSFYATCCLHASEHSRVCL